MPPNRRGHSGGKRNPGASNLRKSYRREGGSEHECTRGEEEVAEGLRRWTDGLITYTINVERVIGLGLGVEFQCPLRHEFA